MKRAALLAAAALIAVLLAAHRADATSGTELYQTCSAAGANAADSRCSLYVHGFIDGMIMGYTAHGTSRGYCPPVSGVSVSQGRAVIEKFLREHPERLKSDASILAGLALGEAFPCPQAK